MVDILTGALAIAGVVGLATVAISKVNGKSLDESLKDVGIFIKKEIGMVPPPEPVFIPDFATIKKAIDGVAEHSRLGSDNTLWGMDTSGQFPVLSVQILPKSDDSLEIAQKAAATTILNVATVCGADIDIETATRPYQGAIIIDIGIATTAAQKSALADYRARKNQAVILDTGGTDNFVDPDFQKDIAGVVIGGEDNDSVPL